MLLAAPSIAVVHLKLPWRESTVKIRYLLRNWFRRPKYQKEDLIIGRHWVFARTQGGRMRFVCGEAEEWFIREVLSWGSVVCAAAGFHEVFAVLPNGAVVGTSDREKELERRVGKHNRLPARFSAFDIRGAFAQGYLAWCRNVTHWRGVKSIVACEGRVAGLTHDGRVLSLSNQSGYEKPEDYDGELERRFSGGGVRRLAVGWLHAAALDSSGRVNVVGSGEYCGAGNVLDWRDVVDIDAFGCYYSPIQTLGLRSDGRVLHTLECPEIDSWRNVVSISCLGSGAVAALTADGHVLLAGHGADCHRAAVEKWPPMAAVRGNFDTLAGISRDGEVWVSDGRRQYCLRRNADACVVLGEKERGRVPMGF